MACTSFRRGKSVADPVQHSGQVHYAGRAPYGVTTTPELKFRPDHSIGAGQVRDPVCGMTVDPHATPHRQRYAGRTHYFCSAGCAAKFAADPEKYLTKEEAKPLQAIPEGTIYTCPMHPQIRQIGPGSCPICGMALEPELVTAEAVPNAELADMSRRFWVGLVLTLPVLALEMGGHLTNLHMLLGQTWSNWLQFAFATPVVLWAGWPFFVRGWQSVVTRNLNMFTLIAMGVGVAWLYSVVAVLLPDLFPPAFRSGDGAVAVYFEAAAVITVLVLLGQVLELRAREQTSARFRALLDLAPKTARRLTPGGTDDEVSLDVVMVGDRLHAPRREGSGRRRGGRGPLVARQIDGHGQVDAGY